MSVRTRRLSAAAGATLMAGGALAAFGGLATARTSHPTVATATNAKLNESVLVNSGRHTLYELAPETSRHLLCTSSQCLRFWPPAKAPKGKAIKGARVSGRLGRLHRHGFDQLTLNGHPLYRFSGDSAAGQANGQGIVAFGGTWHVVRTGAAPGGGTTSTSTSTTASSASTSSGTGTTTTTTTSSTTTSTSTSSTYTYPMY